ncbi:hypothetical protein SAMN06309944_2221 [Micrococcales bacterium KH10]|nr:hypothetical protein SAMN06309944_2221 [Micrococcales bacterium KH10]
MTSHQISPLEPGHVLLHAGMYKAGTTSLQNLAASMRDELREHGVIYPGARHNHARASHAIAGRPIGWSGKAPSMKHWRSLVDEISAQPDTIGFVSHEYFADYSVDICKKVVEGLGRPVTVAITVRNLISLPTSMWQQYLKFGTAARLEPWLRKRLEVDFETSTDQFHTRMMVGRVIEKWANVVGPENVIVIVLDKTEPDRLTRAFESLLRLPTGFLDTPELDPGQQNRSMTVNESSFLCETNKVTQARATLAWSDYLRLYRHAAIEPMLAHPEYDTSPVVLRTPNWAVKQLQPLAEQQAEIITNSGVQVVGDIGAIAQVPSSVGKNEHPHAVPIPLVSAYIANIVKAASDEITELDEVTELVKKQREQRRHPKSPAQELDTWPAKKIGRVALGQVRRRTKAKFRR